MLRFAALQGLCRGQRTRSPGGLSHPSNDDDCLHGMDGNGLKSNRQSAEFGDCVDSIYIGKNPGSIIIPAKQI